MTRLLLACALFALLPGTSSAQSAKVSIFVGPQVRDGFVDVDAGIADSIKDIQEELRKSALFAVAAKEQDATIILRVVKRRLAGATGAVATSIPGGTLAVPLDRLAIETILHVGTYEKLTISEDDGGTWRGAAKQVARDVTVWAQANIAKLVK